MRTIQVSSVLFRLYVQLGVMNKIHWCVAFHWVTVCAINKRRRFSAIPYFTVEMLTTLQQSSILKPDIWRKSTILPRLSGIRRIIVIAFGTEKLEWCGYPMLKNVEDMFTSFDRIIMRTWRTDGQTPHDGKVRAHAQHCASKTIATFHGALQIRD